MFTLAPPQNKNSYEDDRGFKDYTLGVAFFLQVAIVHPNWKTFILTTGILGGGATPKLYLLGDEIQLPAKFIRFFLGGGESGN